MEEGWGKKGEGERKEERGERRRRGDGTNGRRERGEGVTELKAIWTNISLGLTVRLTSVCKRVENG